MSETPRTTAALDDALQILHGDGDLPGLVRKAIEAITYPSQSLERDLTAAHDLLRAIRRSRWCPTVYRNQIDKLVPVDRRNDGNCPMEERENIFPPGDLSGASNEDLGLAQASTSSHRKEKG